MSKFFTNGIMIRNMSGGPVAPVESENVFYVIIDPTFLWHQRNLEFPPKGFSAIRASGVGLMN